MVKLAEAHECTGCMACLSSCKHGAISQSIDARGFCVPEVDDCVCVECGRCVECCPVISPVEFNDEPSRIYAAWSLDLAQRRNSTSGGIFGLIAQKVLADGGFVCGAVINNDNQVEHTISNDFEIVKKMTGSKYVQSDVSHVYSKMVSLAKEGHSILFSGTPCQVAALSKLIPASIRKRFLLIEVVCHGVPSPLIWREYLLWRETRTKSKIMKISFRYKEPSWSIFSMRLALENGSVITDDCYTDPYLNAFLQDYITRECCHSCSYCSSRRCSDITLADFWGYVSRSKMNRNTEDGISLVLINTVCGEDCFESIKTNLNVVEKSFKEAANGNQCLRKPYKANIKKEEFWLDYKTYDFEFVAMKYLGPRRPNKKHLFSMFVDNYTFLLPNAFRNLYEKIKNNLK